MYSESNKIVCTKTTKATPREARIPNQTNETTRMKLHSYNNIHQNLNNVQWKKPESTYAHIRGRFRHHEEDYNTRTERPAATTRLHTRLRRAPSGVGEGTLIEGNHTRARAIGGILAPEVL